MWTETWTVCHRKIWSDSHAKLPWEWYVAMSSSCNILYSVYLCWGNQFRSLTYSTSLSAELPVNFYYISILWVPVCTDARKGIFITFVSVCCRISIMLWQHDLSNDTFLANYSVLHYFTPPLPPPLSPLILLLLLLLQPRHDLTCSIPVVPDTAWQ